jgi:hypothetical protein
MYVSRDGKGGDLPLEHPLEILEIESLRGVARPSGIFLAFDSIANPIFLACSVSGIC